MVHNTPVRHSFTTCTTNVTKALHFASVNKWTVNICNNLGLEAEELVRLKYITGYAKLYENNDYSKAQYSEKQVEEKQKWEKENKA